MIVNPQLFNYRLIIGSLVVVVVVITTISYSSYSTLIANKTFIEQESKLVENELSEMISSYELMEFENKNISFQLEKTKTRIGRILDSVKNLKPNASLISRYKKQLQELKEENVKVLARLDGLESKNDMLRQDVKGSKSKEERTTSIIKSLQVENSTLSETNSNLTKEIEEAKILDLADFKAVGVKRVTRKRVVDTRYASRAKQLQISFTLAANKFVDKGTKDLYIQILDPKNNIVADKGSVKFDKHLLIYTEKVSVDYNNEDIKVSSLIKADDNEILVRGTYFVSVYHNAVRLGDTTIELK